MPRPPIDQAAWQPWIDHVCAAVGVDRRRVDVRAIHDLAGEVAARVARPMGPVAAHLWGLAMASDRAADADALRRALSEATARPESG